MEEIISREIAKKLMGIEGKVRGAVFKADVGFITKEKGREGLKKIEEKMKSLGYVFKYDEIKSMEFYPIGLRAVSLLAIKEVFNFSDEKIKEMGIFVAKSSFVLRLSLKFLGLTRKPEAYYKNTPNFWKDFVTIGTFSVPEYDEKEKRMVVDRIENFNVHPIFCVYLLGILSGFHEVARGTKKPTAKEVKCSFRGDKYHEFLIKW